MSKDNPPTGAAGTQAIPDLDLATKRRTAARKNFTRAANNLRGALTADPIQERNRLHAGSLLDDLKQRHTELQYREDDVEVFSDTPAEAPPNPERARNEELYIKLQTDYKIWLQIAETAAATDAAAAAAASAATTAAAAGAAAAGAAAAAQPAMMSLAGMIDVKNIIVQPFTGEDIRKYPEFKIQWDLISHQLDQIGFSKARKLIELKKVVGGTALDNIDRLPLEDDNYQSALDLLDRAYNRPIKFTEMVIHDLLQAPRMGNESKSINTSLTIIEQAQQALNGLRLSKADAGELVFAAICESKLNNHILKLWTQEKEKKANNAKPCGHDATLEDLKGIIRSQLDLKKMFEQRSITDAEAYKKPEKEKEKEKQNKSPQKSATITGAFTGQTKKDPEPRKCGICSKPNHETAKCFRLTKLPSAEERKKFLYQEKIHLCRNCFKGPHKTAECRHPPQCNMCRGKHHSLLHTSSPTSANTAATRSDTSAPQETSSSIMAAASSTSGEKSPILQSCQALLLGPSGETLTVRVFLDSGCEKSLIRRDVAQMLGLDGPQEKLNLVGIGGKVLPPTTEKNVKFRLRSRDGTYTTQYLSATTKDVITNDLRTVQIDPKEHAHLKDLHFADDYPRGPTRVDILIGVDHYDNLLCGGVIRGRPEDPVAIQTKLGYVLSGQA